MGMTTTATSSVDAKKQIETRLYVKIKNKHKMNTYYVGKATNNVVKAICTLIVNYRKKGAGDEF